MAHHLSKGGLSIPSSKLVNILGNFEAEFQQFHGDTIDKKPQVISCFHRYLCDAYNVGLDSKVIFCYAKLRTFIRIKALNDNIKLNFARAQIRKYKQLSQFNY